MEVDAENEVASVGVKTAVRLCAPAANEEVVVWATPPETATAAPIFVAPSLNCTVPAALDGVTVAFSVTVVPTVCGEDGVTVRAVVVDCATAG